MRHRQAQGRFACAREGAEVLAATPVEPDWIWRGFIAKQLLTAIAGPPKVGRKIV
jgi:hypothetical protein